MKFYGVGCPECEFPPTPVQPGQKKRDHLWGAIFMVVGAFVGFEGWACAQGDGQASWPVFVAGALFFLVGLGTVTGVKGALASAMGGIVCAGMASLGFFAAFDAGPIGGGIPLIPRAWNQAIGKGLFGMGACVTGGAALWLFYRAWRMWKKEKEGAQAGG